MSASAPVGLAVVRNEPASDPAASADCGRVEAAPVLEEIGETVIVRITSGGHALEIGQPQCPAVVDELHFKRAVRASRRNAAASERGQNRRAGGDDV